MSASHGFLIDQKITFKNSFVSQQGMDGLVSTCPQNLISYFLPLDSSHSSHIEFLSIHCLPLAPSHHRAFKHAVSFIMNTFPFPSSTIWLLHKSQLKHHLLRKALHDLPDQIKFLYQKLSLHPVTLIHHTQNTSKFTFIYVIHLQCQTHSPLYPQ